MLKLVLIAAAGLLISAPALACSPGDFAVQKFKSGAHDDCRLTSCPVMSLTGFLQNNCTTAAGAEIKITALDKDGDVISTVEGWPASVRNIAPGASYAFDMGPLMRYDARISRLTVQVIDARSW